MTSVLGFSPFDFLALGAAACWAVTALMSPVPSRHLGAFAFTRWRMTLVLLLLTPFVVWTGGWRTLSWNDVGVMALSGLLGIFLGDTAMFSAMNRLGPRRTGVLFATHAFFGALLGYWVLDERMGTQALMGGMLVVGGVMTAILLGRRKDEDHEWEANRGRLWVGIALGLLAAMCQALSSLVAKPVMASGVDPVAATTIRVGITCMAQLLLLWSGFGPARATNPLNIKILVWVGFNGLIGMGVGMSLILLALRHGNVGTVAILSSVTPVLLLPLLWWRLKRPPAPGAWLGAGFTVLGTALVLLR